jgi:hypothetical protein
MPGQSTKTEPITFRAYHELIKYVYYKMKSWNLERSPTIVKLIETLMAKDNEYKEYLNKLKENSIQSNPS